MARRPWEGLFGPRLRSASPQWMEQTRFRDARARRAARDEVARAVAAARCGRVVAAEARPRAPRRRRLHPGRTAREVSGSSTMASPAQAQALVRAWVHVVGAAWNPYAEAYRRPLPVWRALARLREETCYRE